MDKKTFDTKIGDIITKFKEKFPKLNEQTRFLPFWTWPTTHIGDHKVMVIGIHVRKGELVGGYENDGTLKVDFDDLAPSKHRTLTSAFADTLRDIEGSTEEEFEQLLNDWGDEYPWCVI